MSCQVGKMEIDEMRKLKVENECWRSKFPFSNFQFPSQVSRWLLVAAISTALMLLPRAALAQGCAMCKASAAALKGNALKALESGIIVLIIPPVLIFVSLIALAFRRANTFNEPEIPDSVSPDPLDLDLPKMLRPPGPTLEPDRPRYPQ